MNSELLKQAHEKIPSVPVLVNLISKREHELFNGAKPMVNPNSLLTDDDRRKGRTGLDVDKADVALAEVAQGKLIAEVDFDAIAKAEDAKTKWSKRHVSVNSLFAD